MYYEQKYKEALERARIWQNHLYDTNDRDYADELNYIFPELTESEDERIRKDIIWCLKHSGIKESGPINPHVTTITKDAIAWLEKQGEQKVSYTTIVETGDGGINALVTRELPTDGCDDEQKPTDKVEPKFKVGDWIVNNQTSIICLVRSIRDDEYCLWPLYAEIEGFFRIVDVDSEYHLWTIQDAKDGDVLNSPTHYLIWIYKDSEHYHACVNMNYVTENVAIDGLISIPNDACPATKDEQTILFARMKESGYEWDAEKKQLKKISQRMISAEAKEAMYSKPAWSKEDAFRTSSLTDVVKSGGSIRPELRNEYVDWLKSLRPQSHWKPSDEQMECLLSEVTAWTKGCPKQKVLESLYNDLKKLKA